MQEQTKDKMKVVSVLLTIFLAIVGFVSWTMTWDGPDQCYQDFPNVYSWNHRTDELDAMWADKRLNQSECIRIEKIYQESQRIMREQKVEKEVYGR